MNRELEWGKKKEGCAQRFMNYDAHHLLTHNIYYDFAITCGHRGPHG